MANDASLNLYEIINLYKSIGRVGKESLLKNEIIVKSPKLIHTDNEYINNKLFLINGKIILIKFISFKLNVFLESLKFKYIFFILVNNINIENGINNKQFIIIKIIIIIEFIYLNSPSNIKYPKLIIIGDTTIIIELKINNICCEYIFSLILKISIDRYNPDIFTNNPVNKDIIKEFKKALMKYSFNNISLKSIILINLYSMYIIGLKKNTE